MSEETSSSSLSSTSSSSSSSPKTGSQMKRQNGNCDKPAEGEHETSMDTEEAAAAVDANEENAASKRRRKGGQNNNDDTEMCPSDPKCDVKRGAEGFNQIIETQSTPESDAVQATPKNSDLISSPATEPTMNACSAGNVADESASAVDGNVNGDANVPVAAGSTENSAENATNQRQCRIKQRSYRCSMPDNSSASNSPVRTAEVANNEDDNAQNEPARHSDDSDDYNIAPFIFQYETQSSESNDILSESPERTFDPSSEYDTSFEDDVIIFDDVDENNGDGPEVEVRKNNVFGLVDMVLNKKMSTCKWNTTMEIMWREHGMSNRYVSNIGHRNYAAGVHASHNANNFNKRFYASHFVVERMMLSNCLRRHNGCVNSLNFNRNGDLLCSGSDDKRIVVWDWARHKVKHSFKSGHRENIFQTKFINSGAALDIVSAGRDGQVRRSIMPTSGKTATTCLYKHRNAVHKLVVCPNSPFEILSVGEDGYIRHCDLRSNAKENSAITQLNVPGSNPESRNNKVRLFSIAHHPYAPEVCVCGSDEFVRVYDKRKFDEAVHKMSPSHLGNASTSQVTCCTYNHNGTEILATYSDEQIYLFNNVNYTPESFLHVYRGHYNHRTIKGVNFFGPNSEYVISGSDCGNLFFWEKDTEAIVNFMSADALGVVNCLEPHPSIPVLATSGLDWSVKVWMPGSERTAPDKEKIKTCITRNIWRFGIQGGSDLLDSALNDIILEAFHPDVLDSDDSLPTSSIVRLAHDDDNTSSSSSTSSDSSDSSHSTGNNDHQYFAPVSDISSDSDGAVLNRLTCHTQ